MEKTTNGTILIFADWYVPGYKAGGPIQSVFNLAQLLSQDFKVKVVTRNTDLNSNEGYPGIVSDTWVQLSENHEVMYLSKGNTNFKNIKQLVKQNTNNIILINGLYSFYFSFLPTLLCVAYPVKKVLIAVRGMLHASALSVKPLKKQLFLAFARGFGLYNKSLMLATNQSEVEEIKRTLGKVKPVIAPNIPAIYKPIEPKQVSNEIFTMAFIGRIAPEKNPLLVLNALKSYTKPTRLIFCGGSNNDQYLSQFKEGMSQLPDNVKAEYHADMPHYDIQNLFARIDVMVLPSLGENFGHAIYESFVAGVPVIIGNNTPWKDIESKHAGIEIQPDDSQALLTAIDKFATMDSGTYQTWREGANTVAAEYYSTNNFRQIYLELFS